MIDHRKFGDAGFEVVEARPQEFLTLLGHRPFGVFRKVTVRARTFQLLGQLDVQFVLERLHLFAQTFDDR